MKKSFELIYGVAGSGKTLTMTERILNDLGNGETVYLIVPEQEVMVAERRIADAADSAVPPVSCEELNVLSFRRLANLAFRTYGGISYFPPTEGAKALIMWQAMEECANAGQLNYYTGKRDDVLVDTLLSAVGELKRSGITAGALEEAQKKLPKEDELRSKLSDLSILLTHYNNMLTGSYSDPADDVTRLSALLGEHRLLDGCRVYLDSFNGFTGAESAVLHRIMQQASSVTVALCLPKDPPPTGFETVKLTSLWLRALCQQVGIPEDNVRLTLTERSADYIKPPFMKLERAMRSLNGELSAEDIPTKEEINALPFTDAIGVVRPTDGFAEAEYAAMRILSLVSEGARYRDIAVVGRGIDRFKGVLDTTLSRFDIPYFISDRRPVSETPLFRVILRALALLDGGWRAEDVLSYLKTGMTGLSIDELCELEKYVTLWNVSGYGWTTDQEWTMNPGGYLDTVSEENMALLSRLNVLRDKVRDPLVRLSEALEKNGKSEIPLSDGCAAVYEFITALGIPERTEAEGSEEERTLYNTVIDMLDMLVGVGSDIPVNGRMLSGILSMAAAKTDYGAIPEKMDTVTVGDAALLRAGSVKHVILLGCIDGEFPRAVADDSFFSDAEKEKLSKLDIPTSPGTEIMSDDECFYFYRASSAATETVVFSCPMQDANGGEYQPSQGFIRAVALLGYDLDPKEKKYPPKYPESFSLEARAYSKANSAELYRAFADTAEGSSLHDALKDTGSPLSLKSTSPISDPNATVSPEHTKALFGGNIAMTQYRIESFVSCPFKFYSDYVLKLNKPAQADFSSADVGNFIHRVMEKAVELLFDEEGLKPDAGSMDVDALVNGIVQEVVNGMLGDKATFTARLEALIKRLKRTSALLIRALIEEFEESRFVPSFFELDINNKDGVPPFAVPLSDGTTIHVYGKIDRVDTYKKGDDTYVRIVDYKTGSRSHSLKNIEKGVDLQLLLYLFAIWKADKNRLPQKLRDTKGSILPAGVIYQESTYPTVNCDKLPESREEAIRAALDELGKTGLILDDEEVIDAMEQTVGRGTPRKLDKYGAISVNSGSMLLSLAKIGELADKVAGILSDIGGRLRSGEAYAQPVRLTDDVPCKYCDYRSFCRSAKDDK